MKRCNKPVGKAKNGKDRGLCIYPGHHSYGIHWNMTCPGCGVLRTKKNSYFRPKAQWLDCRACLGSKPQNHQYPGKFYTFPCGCEGFLPKKRGRGNKLACWAKAHWLCRVSSIYRSNKSSAKIGGFKSINLSTPHLVVRRMMEDPKCVLCKETLKWVCEQGKTPHLHHDHKTREIYGFAHVCCNIYALEQEIRRLRKQLAERL